MDLSYAYYYSDRMPSSGGATQQVYKFSDLIMVYIQILNHNFNPNKKIGLGARFQGNWLKASDFVDLPHGQQEQITQIH